MPFSYASSSQHALKCVRRLLLREGSLRLACVHWSQSDLHTPVSDPLRSASVRSSWPDFRSDLCSASSWSRRRLKAWELADHRWSTKRRLSSTEAKRLYIRKNVRASGLHVKESTRSLHHVKIHAPRSVNQHHTTLPTVLHTRHLTWTSRGHTLNTYTAICYVKLKTEETSFLLSSRIAVLRWRKILKLRI